MQHKPSQADHSINDVLLIPLELIRSNRDFVIKARDAHLIDKAMTLEPPDIGRDKLNREIYVFSSQPTIFCLLCTHSRICRRSSLICTHFSFIAPVEGLCCKPKYRANFIHYFIYVLFIYFFFHSACRKDQFTVLSLKFGTQDFTDPGLQNIRRTSTGLSLWFCLHNCL